MEFENIHAYVYNVSSPSLFKSKANERSKFTLISCNNKENCTLFGRGECVLLGFGLFDRFTCPYGKKYVETGLTKRAAKNWKWCSDREKKYNDIHGSLKKPTAAMARIGDMVYLPYNFLNMNKKLPFETHGSWFVSGDKFLQFEYFEKPETIKEIITFKPYAMVGGEIKDYQDKVIPEFVNHLKENFPEIFNASNIDECLVEYIERFSNIGRKAYIKTLKVGCKIWKKNYQNEPWIWDGTFLTCKNYSISFPITRDYENVSVKMVPKEYGVIEITSEDQVFEGTKFLK